MIVEVGLMRRLFLLATRLGKEEWYVYDFYRKCKENLITMVVVM